MKASASRSLQAVRVQSVLVAAAAIPWAWSIAVYPITLGTVYTGPITLWMAVSVAVWVLFTLACVGTAFWVHVRRPHERAAAWNAALAGHCVFMLLIAACGAVVEHGLQGRWSLHGSDLLLFGLPAGLLAIALRKLAA